MSTESYLNSASRSVIDNFLKTTEVVSNAVVNTESHVVFQNFVSSFDLFFLPVTFKLERFNMLSNESLLIVKRRARIRHKRFDHDLDILPQDLHLSEGLQN